MVQNYLTVDRFYSGVFDKALNNNLIDKILKNLFPGTFNERTNNNYNVPSGDNAYNSGTISAPVRNVPSGDNTYNSGTISAPVRMDYNEAIQQAEAALSDQYNRSRENVLNDVNRNLIGRGFYGQAPGDAIRGRTLADLESSYQSMLADYATNLQDRRYAQDWQQYVFEKNFGLQQDMFNWQKDFSQSQFDWQKEKYYSGLDEQKKQRKSDSSSNFWKTIGIIGGSLLGGPFGGALGGWLFD